MSFDLVFGCILWLVAVSYAVMILFITAGLIKNSRAKQGGYRIEGYLSHGQPVQSRTGCDKVSVILPVRNEISVIAGCLDGLAVQDYPPELFEIIVSDDFSEDYTAEKVRHWAGEHPGLKLTLLTGGSNIKENQGKKKAIERAVVAADGNIILCTDADTVHGKSWIKSIASAFSRQEVNMVLAPVGFTGEKGVFQKIQVMEFLGIMGITAGSANLGFPLMCNGANLAYRKQAFVETGGFSGNSNFHSGDDQFLMMKFRNLYGGSSVIFLQDKEAITLTVPCKNLNDFMEQRIRWVSKSRGYKDPAVIIAGLLTFGFHFLILAGGIIGIFNPPILLLASLAWFLKILLEYPLVLKMAGFFDKKHLLGYYFVAQAFQFFYSVTVAMAGQFSHYSWKGRRFRQ
ncbi:MAG: glycosyltransferase [Bacteroidota bacterium]|jgi:cellulose synthase/poly-beta-1,6-N-acetylglucosamine synthase-like glycosyltransferase